MSVPNKKKNRWGREDHLPGTLDPELRQRSRRVSRDARRDRSRSSKPGFVATDPRLEPVYPPAHRRRRQPGPRATSPTARPITRSGWMAWMARDTGTVERSTCAIRLSTRPRSTRTVALRSLPCRTTLQ